MKRILIFFTLIVLSGCKVGPNYRPPPTCLPVSYSEDLEGQTFSIPDEELCRWWRAFHDPFLDTLMEEAICKSFDYRTALAQVAQARAEYWVQMAQVLPEVDGDFQGSRFRTSQTVASSQTNPISPMQDFFQTGIAAAWQLDLFGKLRRTAQAARDTWEATEDEAYAVKITVLSEVASIYTLICADQEKVAIALQTVKLDEQLLGLAESRFEAGLANEQEVQTLRAALEADRADLLALKTALKSNIYSMGTLLGRVPESLLADFEIKRPIPYAGGKVPAGLPSELLRRRPDIRSAERNLAASTELIGVAVADLFPQINLIGSSSSVAANPLGGANVGFTSSRLNKLFNASSRVWGIGSLVSFPILDFGKRAAAVDVQVALQEQAYLAYQKTVITALEEVEQALVSYFNDEKRVTGLSREAEANRRTLDLTADEFQAGLANISQVLQAKEVWLASMNTLTDSRQSLTTDLISIYNALGGDW